ncbi:HupE/UreJ family protein [Actinoplanes sp. CA-142083]|uniref:HupE/UreJ family protein n=1 Tax=Actinoplanes sp. CA-142083 TaxID=3239903 RepID=UPI003D8D55C2
MLLAHGLDAAADTVPGFVWLGFTHMLRGWDHLLFIGGVVLLAGRLRRAAAMLSLFALGHSATLFTASVSGWHVDPELVDVMIALSVVVVGAIAIVGRPRDWTWFAALVFAFGLAHGLGLATRLQALGLPEDGLIPRVLAFNLGVELGQLAAVTVVFLIGMAVRDRISWRPLPRVAAAILVAGGLAAAIMVPLTATGELPFAPGRSTVCTVYDHPASDAGPELAQGLVVVRYQPTLGRAELQRLRAWIDDAGADRVTAEPASQPAVIVASAGERRLTCTAFDEDALRHFVADWLDSRQPVPAR